MKKAAFMTAVVAVTMLVLALLPGCGGDTGKARDYTQKGDKIILGMQTETYKLNKTLQRILTDLSSGKITVSAQAKQMENDLEKASADPVEKAKSARAEFEKVLGLQDVGSYKEYATLRIEAIDNVIKIIDESKVFLAYSAGFLETAEKGQAVNQQEWQDKAQTFFSSINELGQKVNESGQKADKLKKEKNL